MKFIFYFELHSVIPTYFYTVCKHVIFRDFFKAVFLKMRIVQIRHVCCGRRIDVITAFVSDE